MDNKAAEYDELRLGRAKSAAVLRGIVAGYIIYLGGSLIVDHLRGSSTLSPWAVWTAGLGFIAAGAAFGVYVWRRFRIEREKAKLQPPEQQPSEEE